LILKLTLKEFVQKIYKPHSKNWGRWYRISQPKLNI